MKKVTKISLQKPVKNQAKSVLGVAALSAIALLSVPKPAVAADTCGPGHNWVDTCTAGVDEFPQSTAILDLWLMFPGTPMEQKTVILSGPATVFRDDPVDDLLGDPDFQPLLEDPRFPGYLLGKDNNHNGVIKTYLKETFTGSGITLTGKGVGAITKATEFGIDSPELASSFFGVFATIDGPFGKARNIDPVIVYGDRWLIGVPPDVIPGMLPPPALPVPPPPPPVGPDPQCGSTDPLVAIIYCGFGKDFFLVDDEGKFIHKNGKKIKVATLHSERHVVYKSVPESSTALASVFVGLTAMLALKKKRLSQKA